MGMSRRVGMNNFGVKRAQVVTQLRSFSGDCSNLDSAVFEFVPTWSIFERENMQRVSALRQPTGPAGGRLFGPADSELVKEDDDLQ